MLHIYTYDLYQNMYVLITTQKRWVKTRTITHIAPIMHKHQNNIISCIDVSLLILNSARMALILLDEFNLWNRIHHLNIMITPIEFKKQEWWTLILMYKEQLIKCYIPLEDEENWKNLNVTRRQMSLWEKALDSSSPLSKR